VEWIPQQVTKLQENGEVDTESGASVSETVGVPLLDKTADKFSVILMTEYLDHCPRLSTAGRYRLHDTVSSLGLWGAVSLNALETRFIGIRCINVASVRNSPSGQTIVERGPPRPRRFIATGPGSSASFGAGNGHLRGLEGASHII